MNLESLFSFWLDRTARIMKQFSSSKAQELNLGITIDQWVLLATVYQYENISQFELGNKTFKDKASVARISDVLEKEVLIERVRKPENRREYELRCTEKGKEKVQFLLPYVEKARKIGLKNLTKSDVQTLVTLLKKVYQNYENAFNEK